MSPQVVYWLDKTDRIVNVNKAWDDFALANNGQSVTRDHVLGRNLRNFLTGDTTQMFMDLVLQKARSSSETITYPYRCDSPGLKRFMEMNVVPMGNDLLMLIHTCLREETMKPQLFIRPSQRNVRVKRCSICNKINRGSYWEEAWEGFHRLVERVWLEVLYDVCPTCVIEPN